MFARRGAPGDMERSVIRIERDADTARATTRWCGACVRPYRCARRSSSLARGALYDHERVIKAKRVVDLRRAPTNYPTKGAPPRKPGLTRPAWTPTQPARPSRPTNLHVERGKIRDLADAIGDPNPLYRDPTYAAKLGFAGIPAPPTCCAPFLYSRAAADALDVMTELHRPRRAGVRIFRPDRRRRRLTAQERIASVTEKESRRAGKLQTAVIEITFRNQRGEKAQVARRTWSRPASGSPSDEKSTLLRHR